MINRVIFFTDTPFNLRDYQIFGFETLLNNGFEVEAWDFSPYIYPYLYANYSPPDKFSYEKLRLICNKKEAFNAIKSIGENDAILVYLDYTYKHLRIFRALKKNNHLFNVKNLVGELPSAKEHNKQAVLTKLKTYFKSPTKLINSLFVRIPPKILGVKQIDFILAGGIATLNQGNPNSSKAEIIWCHALDYDLYLANKDQKRKAGIAATNYAVFIDQFIPFHPDRVFYPGEWEYDPNRYYPPLVKFFNDFEEKTNLKVVIAAHPRSDYEKRPDLFESRKIIRGKTAELIKNAQLVIAHCSTSINYAVIYDKPVVFVTLEMLQETRLAISIKVIATWLGKSPLNIDRGFPDYRKEFFVDAQKYQTYKNAFIKKSGTPEKPGFQILADFLKVRF